MSSSKGQKQKPIRRANFGIQSRHNIPNDGPLTPSLRREHRTEAIGFTHSFEECLDTGVFENMPGLKVKWSDAGDFSSWTKKETE